MAQLFYGNWFDYQSVPTATTYTSSGTVISTNNSVSVPVVNGLNFGVAISGTQPASGIVTFLVPADYNLQAKQFTVVNNSAAGASVLVSGVGNTLNGATDAVSIAKLTGKTFYNYNGTDWVSY